MNLQFSPFGLIIASPFYVLALWLLSRAWRRLGNSHWRWIAVVLVPVVVVLPFADELWIAWHFQQACKDAGIHVMRKAEVAGFYDDTMPSGYEILENYGFRFMEHQSSTQKGKVDHLERSPQGIVTTTIDKPTAQYHYKFEDPHREAQVGLKMEKRVTQIVDITTKEVIARKTNFSRYPGFIEGLWMHFLSRGQTTCARPLDDHEHKVPTGMLYEHVLVPAETANREQTAASGLGNPESKRLSSNRP